MKAITYRANTRGFADHGWLKATHTFSFANYFNRNRMNFGLLRVLNDDIIAPGMGFDTHPHENMEIITIPLQGALAHGDSMENSETIEAGEVQVMSAGTGITHSEFNASKEDLVNIFQIWVFPREQGLTPRYDQKKFDLVENKLTLLVSPDSAEESLMVNQDVWFSRGRFDKEKSFSVSSRKKGNGLFIMSIDGQFSINGQEQLQSKDAIGLFDIEDGKIEITALSDNADILVIDIPMDFDE